MRFAVINRVCFLWFARNALAKASRQDAVQASHPRVGAEEHDVAEDIESLRRDSTVQTSSQRVGSKSNVADRMLAKSLKSASAG